MAVIRQANEISTPGAPQIDGDAAGPQLGQVSRHPGDQLRPDAVVDAGAGSAGHVPYTLFKEEVGKGNVQAIHSQGDVLTGRFKTLVAIFARGG